LGSIVERKFLEETYCVDFANIPLALNRKIEELASILCADKDEWEKQIFNDCKSIVENKGQSVLIICETVNDVERLYRYFAENKGKY